MVQLGFLRQEFSLKKKEDKLESSRLTSNLSRYHSITFRMTGSRHLFDTPHSKSSNEVMPHSSVDSSSKALLR